MAAKVSLVDQRPKRNMNILGWILFIIAVAYSYLLPVVMFPEPLALVAGKIEALLLGLCILYLYAYGTKRFPWMILLVLAFSEFHDRPVVGA